MVRMRLIRGLHNVKRAEHGGVVTIGNFDGVHLGHQQILTQLREKADELGTHAVAVTFEPYPQEFFQKDSAPTRLTNLREKCEIFDQFGVDEVLCITFNRALSELSPTAFADKVLVEGLNLRHLLIGDDFRFGHRRAGDFDFLKQFGMKRGFSVQQANTFSLKNARVSSTSVRKALEMADFEQVKALLGRPFSITGRVRKGAQLGRQLGFPTANVALHRHKAPIRGVFVVNVFIHKNGVKSRSYPAVANLGVRPTVCGLKEVLEVHLLDETLDLYDSFLSVEFLRQIRSEQKFDSLEALKAQIASDVEAAQKYFGQG